MNYFIKNIHINELFHLKNFDIPIADEQTPHLMITGKNGSGKTVLLNAIADFLERIKYDQSLNTLTYRDRLNYYKNKLNEAKKDTKEFMSFKSSVEHYQNLVNGLYGKIELDFVNLPALINDYHDDSFIIAFYGAARKPQMIELKNPTKPEYNLKGNIKETVTDQFLNFLADLKIQEALARNENQMEDAEEINLWFIDFENLLRFIFQDKDLKLKFNYKNYSFQILSEGKDFNFMTLSDGYAAILDIVVDLILKMQTKDSLTRAYQKKGIVLIDEVETHLHLELQKMIMPFLTKVFPNIQFIITTHSPFVLNSLDNAVAFDLEHREIINELTQYSYEALAEGYFGVSSESSYMQMQLERLESLLQKNDLTDSDKYDIRQLVEDLNKVPESVSPNLVGAYMTIKNRYASVLKTVLA